MMGREGMRSNEWGGPMKGEQGAMIGGREGRMLVQLRFLSQLCFRCFVDSDFDFDFTNLVLHCSTCITCSICSMSCS